MNLRELRHPEETLLKLGFERSEKHVYPHLRDVFFTLRIPSGDQKSEIRLVAQFEMAVSDTPGATWKENTDYNFENVRMTVLNSVEEEVSMDLQIETIQDLKRFISFFSETRSLIKQRRR